MARKQPKNENLEGKTFLKFLQWKQFPHGSNYSVEIITSVFRQNWAPRFTAKNSTSFWVSLMNVLVTEGLLLFCAYLASSLRGCQEGCRKALFPTRGQDEWSLQLQFLIHSCNWLLSLRNVFPFFNFSGNSVSWGNVTMEHTHCLIIHRRLGIDCGSSPAWSSMRCMTVVSSPHLSFPSANGYPGTGWSLRHSVVLFSLPFVFKLAVMDCGSFVFEWWNGVSLGPTVPSFTAWNGLLKTSSQQGQLDSDFWKYINLTWFGWVGWESWLWVGRCCLLGSFIKLGVGMWHGDFCFLWPVVLNSHALVLSD